MGVLSTVTKLLRASTESTHRGDGAGDAPTGAYWCEDCDQRIPDTAVEDDSAPDCPDCGESMAFERSPGTTGCAC
ncbi:zinc-ribbon domain-containing protein [Haloarcula salinisoli]|uniref:Zinc-ribbon domain-containing protein n=1 Tax=Haloarcula salinisoli TaxID=2487746 RepID=A0A8J7YI89_9EURY|nr:zinc-ribbon domain-containing protein [Halomicroarcula salinisoli]MBX0286136.1 zinc-ribbon domain-containing protein [Halomicroarcula salinisoli]MBX0302376.1 zinc-ribbon domain-containing protein [Halomicroarcula salinisoli]